MMPCSALEGGACEAGGPGPHGASCCCACPLEALFRTGLFALFRSCPKHWCDVAVNFSNNPHVDAARKALILSKISTFRVAKNTNSESGLTIDNQRITRCAPTSPFPTIFHVTVLWSIPHQNYPPHSTSPLAGAFHVKVLHHISHHRSPLYSTSPFSTIFHVTVLWNIPRQSSPPDSSSNVLQSAKI